MLLARNSAVRGPPYGARQPATTTPHGPLVSLRHTQQVPTPFGLAPQRDVPSKSTDVTARATPAASAVVKEVKELGLFKTDPQLQEHKDHLMYRWNTYKELKASIESAEGSLAQFAQGYKKLGITRVKGATVYREWAPAAQAAALIGDFSGWKEVWMAKDKWGVWEVTLPDGADGKPAIPHRSRLKIKLQAPGGWWLDRVPAWIKWATVEPGKMGAKYDGVHWDPPANEKYTWRHERPAKPKSMRIYEAHVGMSSEEGKVASYAYFRDHVLPRIKKAGYTAVQLMAIQEHAYYGSFGYHVTSPFAVSSRQGTPDELKSLIDEAHRLGLYVLLDVVHSHMSSNQDDGIAGFDMGQGEDCSYFHTGDRGYHKLWDSRCLNYKNWETLRYLLSNVRFWLEEYKFDGFRFDGVTSMLYWDHGINRGFSGHYHEYFGLNTNVDACVYLMLANELAKQLVPQSIMVAEDVSGMPGLCRPVTEGGLGFDYRLGMAIPDKWIDLLKNKRDEQWSMLELVSMLCNRRYTEKTIGYAESHDQALVGDKTIAFRLMDKEMYEGMSTLKPANEIIERGIALHKLIRAVTLALGGEAYLAFMGNEFGHPEWIDFPREGNSWSHWYCRRQWSLAEADHLRYHHLGSFDRALMELDERFQFLSHPHQWVTHMDEAEQVLVAERGPLVFVFNFSPFQTYEGYKVAAREPGKWRVAMDSDAFCFGGHGRVSWDADHFTSPEPAKFHDRDCSMRVLAPSRSVVAYYRTEDYPEIALQQDAEKAARDRAWAEAQRKAERERSPSPGAGSSKGSLESEDGGVWRGRFPSASLSSLETGPVTVPVTISYIPPTPFVYTAPEYDLPPEQASKHIKELYFPDQVKAKPEKATPAHVKAAQQAPKQEAPKQTTSPGGSKPQQAPSSSSNSSSRGPLLGQKAAALTAMLSSSAAGGNGSGSKATSNGYSSSSSSSSSSNKSSSVGSSNAGTSSNGISNVKKVRSYDLDDAELLDSSVPQLSQQQQQVLAQLQALSMALSAQAHQKLSQQQHGASQPVHEQPQYDWESSEYDQQYRYDPASYNEYQEEEEVTPGPPVKSWYQDDKGVWHNTQANEWDGTSIAPQFQKPANSGHSNNGSSSGGSSSSGKRGGVPKKKKQPANVYGSSTWSVEL